jgi:antitoxin CptB
MKELDMLLSGYLERYYQQASAEEQHVFVELLDLQDPQLYAYILGRETPSDPTVAGVVHKLRAALYD